MLSEIDLFVPKFPNRRGKKITVDFVQMQQHEKIKKRETETPKLKVTTSEVHFEKQQVSHQNLQHGYFKGFYGSWE